jgi:hypothetical protein
MTQTEKITSAYLPEELFEAGHKLMQEQRAVQLMEKSLQEAYRNGKKTGFWEGFWGGFFIGFCVAGFVTLFTLSGR